MNKGSFEYSTQDGYRYLVEYDMHATVTIDSTEGRPGFVVLYFDLSNSTVKVTNKTPGKKAPGLFLTAYPLYLADSFTGLPGAPKFSTFGPLATPQTYGEFINNWPESFEYQALYISPFSNNVYTGIGTTGGFYDHNIRMGALSSTYGTTHIRPTGQFEVGETRQLDVSFGNFATNIALGTRVKVGEVDSSYASLFKNIIGWAVVPDDGWAYSDDTTVVFRGSPGSRGTDRVLLPYLPSIKGN
jgi:hypothetical protein